jgi:hypothetical protein
VANLNALIAQGAQFNIPNPVDQYSKVMQLQAAQEQMQMNRQQAQQIQEDRAGFAKLRETLAGKNLTPEDYEIALTQSPDPSHQKLGIEMRFKRIRLADLDKEMGVGVKPPMAPAEAPNVDNVVAPMDVPSAAVAPVAPSFVSGVDSFGKIAYAIDGAKVSKQEFDDAKNQLAANVQIGLPRDQQLAANALVAQPPAAAPVGNAMASKQTQIAEINRKLDVLNSPRYSDLPGAKGRIDTLERQLKQLTESPVGKVDLDKFDPASVAKFLDSGNFADLKRIETATGGRYLSLGAGRALDQETGKIISEDKIPAATAAPRIINLKTGPHILNEDGKLVPVPVQGGASPAPAAAAQPQAVAGGKPDIRNIKGIPHIFNADTGKLVRIPIEGGALPSTGTSRTLPSTGAGGGVRPAADVKPLTEAQTIKLRTDVGNDYKNASTALSQIDDLLTSATAVKTAPGLSAATGFTGMLPSFPDGAAAQAETRLANLRGKVTALGKATAAMSGAIGSIANQEWKILSDQIAVLNEIKGTGPLLEQIGLLEEQAKGAAARIRDVYEKTRADDFERFPQFRDLPQPKGKKDSGGLTPAEQAELDQLRSRFGKKKP